MDFQECIEVKVLLGKPFFRTILLGCLTLRLFLSLFISTNAAFTGDFFRSGVAIFHVILLLHAMPVFTKSI